MINIEEIKLIKNIYKKNNQDISLLQYIPTLIKYIEDLEMELIDTQICIDDYLESLDI